MADEQPILLDPDAVEVDTDVSYPIQQPCLVTKTFMSANHKERVPTQLWGQKSHHFKARLSHLPSTATDTKMEEDITPTEMEPISSQTMPKSKIA